MTRSFSALNQFMQCERRFWYERVDPARVRLPDNHYQQLGILYHELIAEMIHNREVPSGIREDVQLATQRADWVVPGQTEALVREVEENLARLWYEVASRLQFRAVEVKVGKFGDLVGRLDAIANAVPVVADGRVASVAALGDCVLDWKVKFSTRNRRSFDDALASAQLAQYCLMVPGCHHAAFVEIPRDLREPLRTIVVDFTDEELDRWRRYLNHQYQAIESRGPLQEAYRLAVPGDPLCSARFCPHFNRCPGGLGT